MQGLGAARLTQHGRASPARLTRRQRAVRSTAVAPRAISAAETPAWKGARPKKSSLPLKADGLPDYRSIDRLPQSKLLTALFRKLLVKEVGGKDADPRPWTEFEAIMTPLREINDMVGTADDVQRRALNVWKGILPGLGLGWVSPFWKAAIKPVAPQWATSFMMYLVFVTLLPWLMGPMEGDDFVDVEVPAPLRRLLPVLPASVRVPQSVKAERCRFLETAQCASVCVNSCKAPGQEWYAQDFGMGVHVQPNYEDFSCKWEFNKTPPPLSEDAAILVPCFSLCPSEFKGQKDALRQAQATIPGAEPLEEIARRASPDALKDAGLRLQDLAGSGSKCWSVDEARLAAVKAAAAVGDSGDSSRR